MSWRLRDDPAAIVAAADIIEESTGVPAAHVEKDFWVTEALRATAAQAHNQGSTIVFKGGTSLSKAHRLIRRFSEDIDVLVVVPSGSTGAAERCLKELAAAAGRAMGSEGRLDTGSATRGRKRNVRFDYPSIRRTGGLRPSVLLELGARGGMLPAAMMTIGSLIAEHGSTAGLALDFEEAASFDIRVLHPARTLVEKLMILHHAALVNDKSERIRVVRHYYDVWCLFNDTATMDALVMWPCDALAREVETFTRDAGLTSSPRPTGGFAESPAFSSPPRAVRDAYEHYVLDQLVWGPSDDKPPLDDCCELAHAWRQRL